MAISKSARTAARRGIHRTSLEIPIPIWNELEIALQRRAARLSKEHGIEVKDGLTAWIIAQAKETIEKEKQ